MNTSRKSNWYKGELVQDVEGIWNGYFVLELLSWVPCDVIGSACMRLR
jgi:hypothetical protein